MRGHHTAGMIDASRQQSRRHEKKKTQHKKKKQNTTKKRIYDANSPSKKEEREGLRRSSSRAPPLSSLAPKAQSKVEHKTAKKRGEPVARCGWRNCHVTSRDASKETSVVTVRASFWWFHQTNTMITPSPIARTEKRPFNRRATSLSQTTPTKERNEESKRP